MERWEERKVIGENPDKHFLSKIVKVNIRSDVMLTTCILNNNGTVPLWPSFQKSTTLAQMLEKHQTNPNSSKHRF
jgi:hypothetical protein